LWAASTRGAWRDWEGTSEEAKQFAKDERFSENGQEELAKRGDVVLPLILRGSTRPLDGTPQEWMHFSLSLYACGYDIPSIDPHAYGFGLYRCISQQWGAGGGEHHETRIESSSAILLEQSEIFSASGGEEAFKGWLKTLVAYTFWSESKYGSKG